MVANEVLPGWQLPTATVAPNSGEAASNNPDASMLFEIRMNVPPRCELLVEGPKVREEQRSKYNSRVSGKPVLHIHVAKPVAQIHSPEVANTIPGWNSVPAMRVAIAIRSRWP